MLFKKLAKTIVHRLPWYAEGLRFTCQQCGSCCTGAPGFVWVNDQEREAISEHLRMSVTEFERHYCRRLAGRLSLREHANGDCFFLSDRQCRIYSLRPRQCRTFPFWDWILSSSKGWESAGRRCPGVGKGRLYSLEQIQRIRDGDHST